MRNSDSLRRRPAFRKRLSRFLIVCEGKITERSYFTELRHLDRCPVSLEIVVEGDPKTLVDKALARKRSADKAAKSLKDDNEKFDEVWCVFDVDEHEGISEAKERARANGIRVALSNPCFELWALLHFQDQSAYIHRHEVQKLCRKHMPGYEKKLPCQELLSRYDGALSRAEKLEKWHVTRGTPSENPSTNVYELVQSIRSARSSWNKSDIE